MPIPEDVVLEPKDLSIKDWDDWPTYSLRKIKVSSQQTGEPVSLLRAHKDHPVNVIGHLEPVDSEQSHLVRDQKYKSKAIELTDVTTYAFAEFNDGSYGFWAAGKAGWFEIKDPSPTFKHTYNMMNEAASMFYMLADKTRRLRKVKPNLATKKLDRYAKLVFQDYLLQGKNHVDRADEDEVCEGFHKHSEFLITSMIEGQEGIDWQNSPMFQYFKRNFTDQFTDIQRRVSSMNSPVKSHQLPPEEDVTSNRKEGAKRGRKSKSLVQAVPKTPDRHNSDLERDMDTSGDEPEAGDREMLKARYRKRKSILQPTGSKFSKKAAGRRKSLSLIDKTQAAEDEESDDMQENSPLPPTSHRLSKPNLNTQTDHSLLSPASTTYHDYPPRKYLDLKISEYDYPSFQPQGPGDLWTCSFEGCGHRVYESSTAAGHTKVKDHFQTHAHQAQEKIDLAYKESRPYLPVGNLVQRIQSLIPSSDMVASQVIPERPVSLKATY